MFDEWLEGDFYVKIRILTDPPGASIYQVQGSDLNFTNWFYWGDAPIDKRFTGSSAESSDTTLYLVAKKSGYPQTRYTFTPNPTWTTKEKAEANPLVVKIVLSG